MVKKNAVVNSTIESYLLVNPQLRRTKEDIETLEKNNLFKNDLVRS
jgi:hypothetical protein